jgi:hypothetical protein
MILFKLWRKIKCLLWRHDYKIIKQLSESSQKLKCDNCKRLFAINHDVRVILDWNGSLEQFYIDYEKSMKKLDDLVLDERKPE